MNQGTYESAGKCLISTVIMIYANQAKQAYLNPLCKLIIFSLKHFDTFDISHAFLVSTTNRRKVINAQTVRFLLDHPIEASSQRLCQAYVTADTLGNHFFLHVVSKKEIACLVGGGIRSVSCVHCVASFMSATSVALRTLLTSGAWCAMRALRYKPRFKVYRSV